MNVTSVPAQTVLSDAAMETLADWLALTVTVISFDVAGLLVIQGVALEVITTEITSLVTGASSV